MQRSQLSQLKMTRPIRSRPCPAGFAAALFAAAAAGAQRAPLTPPAPLPFWRVACCVLGRAQQPCLLPLQPQLTDTVLASILLQIMVDLVMVPLLLVPRRAHGPVRRLASRSWGLPRPSSKAGGNNARTAARASVEGGNPPQREACQRGGRMLTPASPAEDFSAAAHAAEAGPACASRSPLTPPPTLSFWRVACCVLGRAQQPRPIPCHLLSHRAAMLPVTCRR